MAVVLWSVVQDMFEIIMAKTQLSVRAKRKVCVRI